MGQTKTRILNYSLEAPSTSDDDVVDWHFIMGLQW